MGNTGPNGFCVRLLQVQQVLNEKMIGSLVIVSIKIKLYLDFNGQFQYMFLRMIASKKVYFAQLRSQKTFYELVEDKFLIIFIGAGVNFSNEDIKTRMWNISVLNS